MTRKHNHVPDNVFAIQGRSNYVVTTCEEGWKVTIRRHHRPEQVVICRSRGEVNQMTLRLADAGFVGLKTGAAAQ